MAKRFRSLLHCVHFLGGTLLCSVAIICVTGSVFGCQLIKAEKDQIYEAVKGTSYELRDYREQLYALSPEKWEEIPLEDKVKTAQVIVNIETAYLGLPDQISVAATDLAPRTLGSYDHERRLILINKEHLDKDAPEECIDTILHEIYHSYQHHLLEIYESTDSRYRNMLHIREASLYVYEFENYINGSEDFDEYSSQSVERDARKYAEDRMNQYRPAIYGLTGLVVN